MEETLLIDDSMVTIIEQIIDTGKSDYLKNLINHIPAEGAVEQKICIPLDEVIE